MIGTRKGLSPGRRIEDILPARDAAGDRDQRNAGESSDSRPYGVDPPQ